MRYWLLMELIIQIVRLVVHYLHYDAHITNLAQIRAGGFS